MDRSTLLLGIGGLVALVVLVPFYFSAHDADHMNVNEEMKAKEAAYAVIVTKTDTRAEIAARVGDTLSWDTHAIGAFASTYAQMQWALLNEAVRVAFKEKYGITEEEEVALMESSSLYLEPRYDFLATVNVPGTYALKEGMSQAEIAELLLTPFHKMDIEERVARISASGDNGAMDEALALVRGERELLPDLVPLPPKDLTLYESFDGTMLSFSTTYYNKGEGPLELLADPATIDVPGDFDRDVFQRIYKEDGTYRTRPAGTFFWHHPHIHYHFADFVLYHFEPVSVPDAVDVEDVQQKSTFCVRDVSTVDEELPYREKDASYKICGRERQGISVGWGDTYFFNYPDQNINVSDFPSGTYRLSFEVNPEDRFDELSRTNNKSSTLFHLDMETLTVEILEETPENAPSVEHVYEDTGEVVW